MAESVVIPSQTTNTPQTPKDTLDLSNFSLPPISKPITATNPNITPQIPTAQSSIKTIATTPSGIPNPTVQNTTIAQTQIPTKPIVATPSIAFNLDNLNKGTTTTPAPILKNPIIPNTQNNKPNENIINLGSLNISTKSETKEDKQKTTNLLISGTKEEPKKAEKKSTISSVQILVGGYIIIFFAIIGSICVTAYSNYITAMNQIQVDETKVDFIEKMQNVEIFLSKYGKINDYANRVDQTNLLTTDDEKDTIASKIKNNINMNYTQKRAILQKNINNLNTQIISNNTTLEATKSEIEKYGFIPKELYDMTQKGEGINNIRRSMLLRENIKFITAFKIFGYMQSFIQSFANDSNIDPKQAESQLNELNKNGEKDVITYTNNCYFNPYEIGDDCGITKDFDNYYTIIDKKAKIDPNFLKKIASYVDKKLKEINIPIYTITFPGFDPKQADINFSTEINTNRQDELALNKIGIINPHLYIITNLINTLKQSLLVVGEDIKIDQIKIVPKTVRVGSTIFTTNTSKLNFKLPIQKTDQREISDFFSTETAK